MAVFLVIRTLSQLANSENGEVKSDAEYKSVGWNIYVDVVVANNDCVSLLSHAVYLCFVFIWFWFNSLWVLFDSCFLDIEFFCFLFFLHISFLNVKLHIPQRVISIW